MSEGDRYRRIKRIGAGAGAEVYEALDTKRDLPVALKIQKLEKKNDAVARQHFHREARALMQVDHPNVVAVLDYSGKDADELFLVTELLHGQSMAELSDARGACPKDVACAVLAQAAAGLAAVHTQSLLHRDLSLQNIFVTDTGRVVLVDFGLAVMARREAQGASLAGGQTGLIGTPLYFAPELLSEGLYAPASDLYALGVCFTRLILGRDPVDTSSVAVVLTAILQGTLERATGLPPSLQRLADSLCAREASARPVSAALVCEQLMVAAGDNALADCERRVAKYLGAEATGLWNEVTSRTQKIEHAVASDDVATAVALQSQGRFVLGELLGQGAMGRVYGARDTHTKRAVAVKTMLHASEEQRARFYREARALARLSHANIVQYIADSGRDAALPYLVMERLSGADFDALQKARAEPGLPLGPPMDEDVVLSVAWFVARALSAAHSGDVVHRDLKPSNVFLTVEGRVVLTDFGIARGVASSGTLVAQATRAVGTPHYASPEQFFSPGSVGPRSDLFSLGALMAGLLLGSKPIGGDGVLAVSVRLKNGEFVDLPASVSVPTRTLVARLRETEPSRRPSSAHEVAELLKTLLQSRRVADPARTIAAFFGVNTAPSDDALNAHDLTSFSSATQMRRSLANASEPEGVRPKPARRTLLLAAFVGAAAIAGVGVFLALRERAPAPSRGGASGGAVNSRSVDSSIGTSSIGTSSIGTTGSAPDALHEPAAQPAVPTIPIVPAAQATDPRPVAPIEPRPKLKQTTRDSDESLCGLKLNVKPWGKVIVDGQPRGQTPLLNYLELSPGAHTIRIEHPAFDVWEQVIRLKAGETKELAVKLHAAATH